MKKNFLFFIPLLFILFSYLNAYSLEDNTQIYYSSHVQSFGWQDELSNGISGTIGLSKRLEAFKIRINSNIEGNVKYSAYVENVGWQNYITNNGIAGTTGESKTLYGVKIVLEGQLANYYDIYYRTHVQSFGWQDWVKNDEISGRILEKKRMEAIEIKLVKKGTAVDDKKILYSSHVQSYGWQDYAVDGDISGTTGLSKRIESFKIKLADTNSGGVEYSSYIENKGWESSWKSNDELSGTVGEYKRIEAIKIRLTGDIANTYDVYYRVHSQSYGWLGWAKDGEVAGSIGYDKRIEAIQIKLVEKGAGEETGQSSVIVQDGILYQAKIKQNGWQEEKKDSETAGTTGQSMKLNGLKVKLQGDLYGSVQYNTYSKKDGWSNIVSNGNELQVSDKIEAIKINLLGNVSEKYDIYYRAHVQGYGWLDWAKNGEIAGILDFGFRLEAFEIKLVKKGEGETTGNSYIYKETNISYQSHVRSYGTMDLVSEGLVSGTIGQSLRMEAFKINLDTNLDGSVQYKSYVADNGWENDYVLNGNFSGTMGQSKAINLIEIKLTGELAEKYNIYYRVHSEEYGWLGWAKNGEIAGVTYYDIQAIQIKLYLKKDYSQNELTTNNHYIESGFYSIDGKMYYRDKYGNQANDWININGHKYFFNSLGEMIGKNVKKIIDVSKYQDGKVNWAVAKNNGQIDGAIIRCAYRGYGTGALVEDYTFYDHVNAAKAVGVPTGTYVYSQAISEAEAIEEANLAISMANNANITSKIIAYDTEKTDAYPNGRADTLDKQLRTTYAIAFLETVKNAGYVPVIYANKDYIENSLDLFRLSGYQLWYSRYNHNHDYSGNMILLGWQYSSKESVIGIDGNVDVSVWFGSF